LLGHNLLDEDRDNRIDKDDWLSALHRTALELQKKDFAELYNFESKATAKDAILDVLAVAGRPLTKLEIDEYCKVKNIYQYLPELKKRGSVKQVSDSDKITLHSQLFRTSVLLKILPRLVSLESYLEEVRKKEWGPQS
jgi:hypothetical protein